MNPPSASRTPSAVHLADARAGADLDAEVAQQAIAAAESRSRQGRQIAVAASISVIRMSFSGVDPVEAVGDHGPRGAMQFGRQLGPGGAGADDRNVQLPGPHRPALGVRADAGVDKAPVEPHRLLGLSSAIACSFTPGVPKSLTRCRWR